MRHEHLPIPWLILLAKATRGDALTKTSTKPAVSVGYDFCSLSEKIFCKISNLIICKISMLIKAPDIRGPGSLSTKWVDIWVDRRCHQLREAGLCLSGVAPIWKDVDLCLLARVSDMWWGWVVE